MSLIVYYVVFMIVGDFAAYFLGLFTEYEWGSQVSLIVFLALYFLFLWVSWVLAGSPGPNLRSSKHLDLLAAEPNRPPLAPNRFGLSLHPQRRPGS